MKHESLKGLGRNQSDTTQLEDLQRVIFGKKCLDILMVSEKRIDKSFPRSQSFKEAYATRFRIDYTTYGGDILLLARDYILCNLIKID